MGRQQVFRRWALLLFPSLCAAIASATPPDPRLLSLVPHDPQLLAGISSSPGEGHFLLFTGNNEVDLQDFVALSGVDDTRVIRQVILVASLNVAGQAEHSLLASGHFDQARIFTAAVQNGATVSEYRGIKLLVLQPFARERAVFKDVRWLAILGSGVALFGTTASAQEEMDRYVDRNAPDPWLTQKLARMHSDDETWCIVENFALNGDAQRALSRLDRALADLTGNGDAFQFGIHLGRRVRFEYEITRASGGSPQTIFASLVRSLAGKGVKESSLMPVSQTTSNGLSERGELEVSRARYETWIEEMSARALEPLRADTSADHK
ncbi:MAG TPA: hypothetical protein VGG62_13970 [Terracidiphilus sp.]|jgi:hypothetical protein